METNEQNEGIIKRNLELLLSHQGYTQQTMGRESDVCPITIRYNQRNGLINTRQGQIMIGKFIRGRSDLLWLPEHYEGVDYWKIFVVPPNFGSHPGDEVLEESFRRYNEIPEDGVRK